MGIDLGGMADKAKEFLGSDQAQELLKSEQAEGVSDAVLDKVEDVADKVTGGKFDEQVSGARGAIDGLIGNQ